MKTLITTITFLVSAFAAFAHKEDENLFEKYKYPQDERTGKITYAKTIDAPGISKAILFKRAQEFVASQNFDRVENIHCKNGTDVAIQLYDKSLKYSDESDGKLLGNGFLRFKYRDHERFVIAFKYKIAVKENAYRYEFTDFRVLEFISAPKEKKRGSGMASGYGGAVFASGSSTSTLSANQLLQFDLEEFIKKSAYHKSHPVFKETIKRILGDLKVTMGDNF